MATSTSWTLWWAGMVLNAAAWFIMLLGSWFVRSLHLTRDKARTLRLCGYVIVCVYWGGLMTIWLIATAPRQ